MIYPGSARQFSMATVERSSGNPRGAAHMYGKEYGLCRSPSSIHPIEWPGERRTPSANARKIGP